MMMQDWADRLDGCERGEPITQPVLPKAASYSMAGIENYLRLLAQGRLPQPTRAAVRQHEAG